jgi:hypothetical protein
MRIITDEEVLVTLMKTINTKPDTYGEVHNLCAWHLVVLLTDDEWNKLFAPYRELPSYMKKMELLPKKESRFLFLGKKDSTTAKRRLKWLQVNLVEKTE